MQESFQWPSTKGYIRISKEFKIAFLSACFAGIIVHLYVFSNLLLNWDSCGRSYSAESGLLSGRWAFRFVSSFSTFYQLPVVNGLISIIMIALTAGITVSLLRLSHPASVVFVAAFLVSYPTVSNAFAYMFAADLYFVALFLNALSVFLTKKYRFGFLPAVVLIAVACGIYQSYICYAISLFLFDCILSLLEKEEVKAVLLKGLEYILVLVGGLFLYTMIENLLLLHYGLSLASSTYQGMNTISSPDWNAMLSAIPNAYKGFIDRYLHWPFILPVFRLLQFAMPLFFGGSLIYLTVLNKLYREPLRLFLGILGVLMLPLSLNFVGVLAYKAGIHILMIYAHVLFFVFTIKTVELASQQMILAHVKHWSVLPLAALLCCCAIIWNNFCLCNIGYHSLQSAYENSVSVGNRAISQIEALEGFTKDTPVALIGAEYSPLGVSAKYAPYVSAIALMNNNTGIFLSTPFLCQYCGLNCGTLSSEQRKFILNSEEVANMPIFPSEGSVCMIDGVAVVRLGKPIYIR